MNEYEVLDTIWEDVKEDITWDLTLHQMHMEEDRPEMYAVINGECWRIKAERHYHKGE